MEPGADRPLPGTEYRVLSVQPPWAWSIMFAGKDIENRSWKTPFRGRFLIHASSKNFTGEKLRLAREEIAQKSGKEIQAIPHEFPRSQILGSVELVDIVTKHRSPWTYPDEMYWVLRAPLLFDEPVRNIDGKLNLWRWTSKPARTPKR